MEGLLTAFDECIGTPSDFLEISCQRQTVMWWQCRFSRRDQPCGMLPRELVLKASVSADTEKHRWTQVTILLTLAEV